MLIKEAHKITGGLSAPSKMPGPAYNLPASQCITGSNLLAEGYDRKHGMGTSPAWKDVRKGLDWFRQHFAKEYMVLLD